jgi:proteasome lid subunit RPN8/RPN11
MSANKSIKNPQDLSLGAVRETEVLELQSKTLDQIYAHAKVEFPDECCGIILSDGTREFVRECRNIQNERHAEDPDTYPRDARTAYLIAPNDLIRVHKEAETKNRPIKAFYHSHPNHDAYFSEKDKADATAWDEPAYPGAAYVVVSVYDREVKTTKAFAWNENDTDFAEVPIHAKCDA